LPYTGNDVNAIIKNVTMGPTGNTGSNTDDSVTFNIPIEPLHSITFTGRVGGGCLIVLDEDLNVLEY
jgi:hypothetical protein